MGFICLQAAYLDGLVFAMPLQSLPSKSKFYCVFKPKVTTSSLLNGLWFFGYVCWPML